MRLYENTGTILDGMDDFQAATVEIAAGRYKDAVRLLHEAERKAGAAKPVGPVDEMRALREMCEGKAALA